MQETGLNRQAMIDMACFVPQSPARPTGEGRQAFVTASIFTDAALRDWMMGIFKSDERFGFISKTLIRDNLRTVLNESTLSAQFQNNETLGTDAYLTRQRAIERNLAMRVARMHNSGAGSNWKSSNVETLLSNDAGAYVAKFLGANGNWPSLRCATPSKAGSGWHGLHLSPLQL